MYKKSVIVNLILVSLLSACNLASLSPATSPTASTTAPPLPFPTETSISPTETVIPVSAEPLTTNQVVLQLAGEVISAIKGQNFATLAQYVYSGSGLRFSPYAFVKDTDQVIPADEVADLMSDSTIYHWGLYDGSGEPIELTFADYYSDFVYDVDFANAPQVALNHRLSEGNTIDNSLEFYPGAKIVEYHFPGFDPQYQGMDWRSLRLVFQQFDNTWYLVGIIHDEWTI